MQRGLYAAMFNKKEFFKLFWPVLIEQILGTTIGMVNTMMVSGVSVSAISAVSIVDSLNFVIMNLFIAFSTGGTVVVAQRIGAKDMDKANETASQAMSACVLSAILSGLAFSLFGHQIISGLFGEAEELVKTNALTYLIYSGLSYPFLAIFSMSSGILRASGNTKSPMRASVLSNVVNVGVGALCIYILKLGVTGAGLALLFSRISSAAVLSMILFRPEAGAVGIRKIAMKFNKALLKPVLQIGLPACIDGLIFNGGKLLIQTLVTALGTVSLAANGVANSVNGFTCIPGNAISIVAITMVGQAVGAGIFGKELKKIIRSLNLYAMGLLGIMTLVVFPLLPFVVGLYDPPKEVMALALPILHLALIMMPLTWPIAFILPSCIRSTGDSLFVTIASIISMWLVRVLGAWYVVRFTSWGIMGIWVFWCLDWVVRGIIFTLRTRVSPYIGQPRNNLTPTSSDVAEE